MIWPNLFARHASTVAIVPAVAPEPPVIDLHKFDALDWREVEALPKRLRRAVQADRKARTTAVLARVGQSKGSALNV